MVAPSAEGVFCNFCARKQTLAAVYFGLRTRLTISNFAVSFRTPKMFNISLYLSVNVQLNVSFKVFNISLAQKCPFFDQRCFVVSKNDRSKRTRREKRLRRATKKIGIFPESKKRNRLFVVPQKFYSDFLVYRSFPNKRPGRLIGK